MHVTLLGGGFGRKSKPDFVHRGGAPVPGDGRQAGEGHLDARGRPASRLLSTPCRSSASRPVSTTRGCRSPGCTAASRRPSCSIFAPDPKHEAAVRARHGRHQHALRHPEPPGREPGGRRAYPHRLVPLGVEHPARLRHPVLRRRARGMRPGAIRRTTCSTDRAGAHRSTRGRSATPGTTARIPKRYPIDTGRLRRVVETVRARQPAGAARMPKGSGLGIAAHYSFVTYVAVVGGGTRSTPSGELDDSARRHRHRLRAAGQPRSRALADGGRRASSGVGLATTGRDQLQERPRPAGQLRRLRGDAHRSARRARSACICSRPRTTVSRSAGSASPACRPWRRRSQTRSSRRPASASDSLPIRDQLKV